jgi:ribosomal protein L11 methyltransferase
LHWIETKVVFSADDEPLTVELVSDVFYGLGAKGVVVDDPHMQPEEGWGADALPLPAQPAVTGYIAADARLEQHRLALESALAGLAARHPFQYSIHYRRIDEEDWAESWKEFFLPVRISEGLVVKPTWREYAPRAGEQIIEIDPGMAFGTGTHPTTAMCVRLLEKYIRPGIRVLDVGTGSGILLIAAARLGAGPLAGVDLDPIAVDVAARNLGLNHIQPEQYRLNCGHLVDAVTGSYDLVTANILADVIVTLLDDIRRVLEPGGIFIGSGIIQACRRQVAEKMAACGFSLLDALEQDGWVALTGRLAP